MSLARSSPRVTSHVSNNPSRSGSAVLIIKDYPKSAAARRPVLPVSGDAPLLGS